MEQQVISLPLNQLSGIPLYTFLIADAQREVDYYEGLRSAGKLEPSDEAILNEYNAAIVQHQTNIDNLVKQAGADTSGLIDEINYWIGIGVAILNFIKALPIVPDWAKSLIDTLEKWIKALQEFLKQINP